MTPLRLGAVSYLNARPLVYGLAAGRTPAAGDGSESERVEVVVRFDVPSVCAGLLASGDIDLGLVPSIAYFDAPDQRIVPGVAIASTGAVASVALFTRRPVREVRSVTLDTSSRTSAALTRILCARLFDVAPSFIPHAPDLPSMLAAADAALLIGDPALFADYRALEADKVDLGLAWGELTALPFVWAFWLGRLGAAGPREVGALQRARDAGVQASDKVADAYAGPDAARRGIARRYLRENIQYALTPAMLDGLRTYYREAAALDLIPPDPADPAFFPEPARAGELQ